MKLLSILTAAIVCGTASLFAQAPAGPSPESRLREQIKTLMSQVRTAETAQAALTAEKAALEEKVKAFQKQAEEDTKARTAEKEAAKKEAELLKADLGTREKELSDLKVIHLKADEFGKQSAARAEKLEAERAKLAAESDKRKRIVADQRVKNAKMYEISTELLDRYRKFGLGTALTAREPFVGITRARLETLVEELGAKAADQRIRMDGTSPKPAAGPTAKDRPADGKPAASKP